MPRVVGLGLADVIVNHSCAVVITVLLLTALFCGLAFVESPVLDTSLNSFSIRGHVTSNRSDECIIQPLFRLFFGSDKMYIKSPTGTMRCNLWWEEGSICHI